MTQEKTIADEINELRAMPVAELVVRYEAVFGKPPRIKHRDWLWRKIAWKIQEQRYGGLSATALKRLDELIAEIDLPLGSRTQVARIETRAKDPLVGTTVVREWKGKTVTARAIEGGKWEHEGVVYRSLSAVAKAVTGSHWNGRLFFNLTQRRAAK